MDIQNEYVRLNNPPNDVDSAWMRRRGYDFEKLISKLLIESGLDPRTSYKAPGEQIDGSFIYGEKVFLLEAKWHKPEMPASQIYEFKGKVDGKLVGTIGIFISMSGFSADAVDALMYGKDINIILFDKADFEASIDSKIGFKKVLNSKIRNAAEVGTAFYPYSRVDIVNEDARAEDEGINGNNADLGVKKYAFDLMDNKLLVANTENIDYGDLVIICEGKMDQFIFSRLSEEILEKYNLKKKISIITAMGKYTIAKIASNIKNSLSENTKLLMIADSDEDAEKTIYRFKKMVDFSSDELILIDNRIEDWLELSNYKSINHFKVQNNANKYQDLSKILDEFDYEKVKDNHKSFDKFYSIISNL